MDNDIFQRDLTDALVEMTDREHVEWDILSLGHKIKPIEVSIIMFEDDYNEIDTFMTNHGFSILGKKDVKETSAYEKNYPNLHYYKITKKKALQFIKENKINSTS